MRIRKSALWYGVQASTGVAPSGFTVSAVWCSTCWASRARSTTMSASRCSACSSAWR